MTDWTSEPETIERGLHRIPLPLPGDGLRAVNVYVIETESGLTCIDGGWALATARKKFAHVLSDLGFKPDDIDTFLVTHVHRDHYTQAIMLREEFGRAVVHLGRAEQPALSAIRARRAHLAFVERLANSGAEELAQRWLAMTAKEDVDLTQWSDPDHWMSGDFDIAVGDRTLRAVTTPGHTPGHYVFADLAAGVLFAGDHVLPSITPSIGFTSGGDSADQSPLRDFLGSLTKVQDLPDLRLLPAHGATNRRSHERAGELLAHHADRLDVIARALEDGAMDAFEVASAITWTRHQYKLTEMDDFNAGLAVLETQLHLDVLAARDQTSGS